MKAQCEICRRGTFDSDISIENDLLREELAVKDRRIETLEALLRESLPAHDSEE